MQTTIIADIQKEITYCRETRDYDMHIIIDGTREYIGSARNHSEAETITNQYAFDYLMDSQTIETATELLMEIAPPANWPREFATGKPMDWYAVKEMSERGAI